MKTVKIVTIYVEFCDECPNQSNGYCEKLQRHVDVNYAVEKTDFKCPLDEIKIQ